MPVDGAPVALYTITSLMSRILPPSLLLTFLLLPGLGHAHIGAGAGDTDVLPRSGSPNVTLLEASWGLVVSDDGESFDWICHEVLSNGVAELPEFEVSSEGMFLGVTGLLTGVLEPGESLYYSPDDGCTWSSVTGTTGRLIQDASFDPESPMTAIAVTADGYVDGEPLDNTIFRSTDGGRSFDALSDWDGLVFREVRFGRGGVVYALGVRLSPERAVLLRSDNAGEDWVEYPIPGESLESPSFGVISAIDPGDSQEVWLTFDGNQIDGVVRTRDGGATFEVMSPPVSAVLDVTLLEGGGGWMIGDARALWSSEDRIDWESHPDAPQVWGAAFIDGELRLAVNTLAHPQAVVRTVDGESFDTVLETLDLRGAKQCPAGTSVATTCEPLFDTLYRTLELMRPRPSGDDDDSSSPEEPVACEGCSALGDQGASGSLILLLALAYLCGRYSAQRVSGSPETGATIR